MENSGGVRAEPSGRTTLWAPPEIPALPEDEDTAIAPEWGCTLPASWDPGAGREHDPGWLMDSELGSH